MSVNSKHIDIKRDHLMKGSPVILYPLVLDPMTYWDSWWIFTTLYLDYTLLVEYLR